jgi:hypothetical protein
VARLSDSICKPSFDYFCLRHAYQWVRGAQVTQPEHVTSRRVAPPDITTTMNRQTSFHPN